MGAYIIDIYMQKEREKKREDGLKKKQKTRRWAKNKKRCRINGCSYRKIIGKEMKEK